MSDDDEDSMNHSRGEGGGYDDDDYLGDGGGVEEEEEEDEMYDFDSTPVSRQNSFRTMDIPVGRVKLSNFKELDSYASDLCDSFGSFLALDKDQSESLLISYKWNKERALDDFISNSEKMIANAGLSSYDATTLLGRIRRNTPTGEEMTCSVCFDTKDFADCFALGCNHWFCKDCYSNSLEATLETTGCSTKCIANGMVLSGGHKVQCNERVVPLVYRELPLVLLANGDSSSSNSLFEMATSSVGGGGASSSCSSNIYSTSTSLRTYNDRYRMKVVRNLIENNPSSMTYCPGLDCEMVAVGSEVTKVVCSCGTRYCFRCKEPDHEPCSCDNYKSWKVRANEEGLNVLWINENTQRCPKLGCNNPIEKNGGCDWIRCKCRHEFCWICDSEWFNHTTVRHPNCPGMKVRVLGHGGSSAGISTQTDNHLFSYCFTRYKLHQNCEKHALEGLKKFQKQCESPTEGDIQVDFTHMEKEDIKNAWKLVSKCRCVLTYAYVFIYYQSKEVIEKQEKIAAATSPKAPLNGGSVFALGGSAPNANPFLPPAAPAPAAAAAFKKTTTPPLTTASSMVNDNQTFISNPLFDEQLKMLERQTEKLQGFIERKINSPDETRQYMRDIYNHNELLTRYIDSLVKSVVVDL